MPFYFEKALEKLKQISEKIEQEDLTLEESVQLYSEGIVLYKKCIDFLEKTKRKVEIVKNISQPGIKDAEEIKLQNFEEE